MKELGREMMAELVLNVVLSNAHDSWFGIMPVYGLSRHPKTQQYLMVMAYAGHGTLEHRSLDPPTNWYDVSLIARSLACSLSDLHASDISHNDLHPGNVAFTLDHVALLINVGLSQDVRDSNVSAGAYGRNPEVFEGHEQTQRSDVYCYATMLWQLITGVPPSGVASVAVRTRAGGMREEMIPGAPEWLRWTLEECWNADPEARPDRGGCDAGGRSGRGLVGGHEAR
ncbi:kinase-like domain-containing protein [Jimgerdemannia flammicorona]|uniref:Kinase-like domain-containing protein n=1 Tax=Jimgerdemannia flammicorona TaxID=994334 RepID=A0A433Q2K5_9FUNG|nr:kinase-like domain-containing protein [Jimgerdemannia flammicorona]